MCIYIYSKITKLLRKVIVRLSHPRSGDSEGQETLLAPSADKSTCNYDIECYVHIYIYVEISDGNTQKMY